MDVDVDYVDAEVDDVYVDGDVVMWQHTPRQQHTTIKQPTTRQQQTTRQASGRVFSI